MGDKENPFLLSSAEKEALDLIVKQLQNNDERPKSHTKLIKDKNTKYNDKNNLLLEDDFGEEMISIDDYEDIIISEEDYEDELVSEEDYEDI